MPRCFECSFSTKDTYTVVPGGKPLPLCRMCQQRIPKAAKLPYTHQNKPAEAIPIGRRGAHTRFGPDELERAQALLNDGIGLTEIASRLGFSYATVWKALRKARLVG